jgi:ABC-type transport system substrate-binding protein
MKKRLLFSVLSLVVVLSMLLVACTPSPTPEPAKPTEAPKAAEPTKAPEPAKPTEAPKAAEPTKAPEKPATDFKAAKLEAPDCKYGGEVKAIEAVDPLTIKFTLCNPDVAFPAKVAFASNPIFSKAFLETTGGVAAKINEKPIGTGPYMFKEWVRGDHLTLEANPNYWGPKPKNQTLIFKWSKEPAQRLLELQSGNADGIDNPAPDDYETIQKDAALAMYPRAVNNLMYFGFNNTIAPFDNEKVRQAFAMGIDRARIVENFYQAGSRVPDQFVPPEVKPGYTDGFKWYDYNTEEAKKLLKEANFDFNKEYTFSYRDVSRSYVPQPGKVAQDLQAQLKELGVKIKLNVMESGAFLESVKAGKEGFFLLGWGEDYPDATDWYDYHFSANHKDFGKPYEDLVAAFTKGATTADTAARQKAYDEVNTLVKQHVPVIPVAHGVSGVAMKKTVKNVVIGPYWENFPEMETENGTVVFVQNAEPISLYCADEEDGESLRACKEISDTLLTYEYGGVAVKPNIAEKWEPNKDLSEWTFTLRKGVKFHDGTELTSMDVFTSYTVVWDASNPLHKGNTGSYNYWVGLFGDFINKPKK